MQTYNIKISFKSKCSKDDLIDENNLIYDFIKKNFWNIEDFNYKYKEKQQGGNNEKI